MTTSFKTRINISFACALSLLLFVSYFAFTNTTLLINNARMVTHTYQVLASIEALESVVKDMETGQRGFVLIPKEEYLESFRQGLDDIPGQLTQMRTLIRDNPSQVRRMDGLNKLLNQKIILMRQIVQIRREKGLQATLKYMESDNGNQLMTEIRILTEQMKEEEHRLLAKREEEATSSAQETLQVAVIGSLIAILVIFGAGIVINRTEDERVKTAKEIDLNSRIKTSLNMLNTSLRGEQTLENLCQNILDSLASQLAIPIGSIYLTIENSNDLRLTATHAYTPNGSSYGIQKWGEGLVGQTAKERKPTCITQLPPNYLKVISGLGDATPSCIYVLPLVFEERTIGVLELGSFTLFDRFQSDFLDASLEGMTLSIIAARNRALLGDLLSKSRDLTKELTAQQEELRQSNEELQQQSEILKESEEELKSQAEELRQTNEELAEHTSLLSKKSDEINVKNIALEESQKTLRDAMAAATEANRAKSTFLANMSHELRTPLNSILILSELLSQNRDKNLSTKQIEFAKSVHQAGSDLLNLINDILDLSKVEAGRIDLHLEDLAIEDIVQAMQRNFEPVAKNKQLQFNIDLQQNLPTHLHSDMQRLEQILKNLLGNAFKFTADGSVTLKIYQTEQSDGSSSVTFTVIDTGCGIPLDKQQLMFEAFKQADSTISRKYGGSGLGLSIARQLARLLGGDVTFQSEEGKGSAFHLILPEKAVKATEVTPNDQRDTANRSPAPQPVPAIEKPTQFPAMIDRKEILIIEDDQRFAQVLAQASERKGFKAVIANTAKEGLSIMQQRLPRAILLDLHLPDMDGMEIMRLINNDPRASRIPVQVITGSDRELEAMQEGAIGFLSKPVSAHKIEQIFQKVADLGSHGVKNVLLIAGTSDAKGVAEQFRKCNIEVTVATTGSEAMQILNTTKFDAFIIDNQRSDAPTLQLVEQINEKYELSHIPLIIYSDALISAKETDELKRYAKSIIIRGTKSRERLLDEVQLFLHSLDQSQQRKASPNVISMSRKPGLFKGTKVLLVDDDSRNIFALLNVLEEEGVNVIIGKNGKEGLDQLNKNPDVQLVLMDIMMPEMDGYEAMRRIRKDARFTNLPIIALTAKAMKDDRSKCIEAGATDYLPKPIEIDKLLSIIAVWLGNVSRKMGDISNG